MAATLSSTAGIGADVDLLHQTLTTAVRRATGLPDAGPREGQWSLTCDISEAIGTFGQTVGMASTGTGKSLAYLVPAMLAAATKDQRTVISTESLGLQAQIVSKDAPVVAAAVAAHTGKTPTVALLKGWSNYVCGVQTISTVAELTKTEIPRTFAGLSAARAGLAGWNKRKRVPTAEIGGQTHDRAALVGLIDWALGIHSDEREHGDTDNYADADNAAWGLVSLTPSECIGKNDCPLADACKPLEAKSRATASDIIVTNHAMLAVQAATTAPVVIGSPTLGLIDHLVVDEAHALPDRVRSMGAVNISARRITDVIYAYGKAMDDPDATEDGWGIAEALDSHLCGLAERFERTGKVTRSGSQGGVATLQVTETPLDGIDSAIDAWVRKMRSALPETEDIFDLGARVKVLRARSKIDALVEHMGTVNIADPEHARWLEVSNDPASGRFSGHALKASPVDVSGAMRATLYSAEVPVVFNPRTHEDDYVLPETRWLPLSETSDGTAKPRYALSVTAVSATLAPGFAYDAGLSVRQRNYPSPFADAYAGSLLYVPRAATPQDLEALTSTRYGPQPRFDTTKHVGWASAHIQTLVATNHGSALVLAATAAAGRQYADDLRKALAGTGIPVMSQWDAGTTASSVARWRADTDAVLVGTRSLMTGVDAPGETCSLVIIDRVPRAAGNPVDDARVRTLQARADFDKRSAERMVYTSDAALLLEQAAGRLIRRVSDRGMLVVLDPRLLKSSTLRYPEPTRQMLMTALEAFPVKTAVEADALAWLHARAAQAGAA